MFPGIPPMAQQALGAAARPGAGGRGAADATRVPWLGAAHPDPQRSHRLGALSITLLRLRRPTSLPAATPNAGRRAKLSGKPAGSH